MPITRRRRANPPDQPEDNNNHVADQTESAAESLAEEQTPTLSQPMQAIDGTTINPPAPEHTESMPMSTFTSAQTPPPPTPSNGDRGERQDYPPAIESGRRTARGELFRRPPQPPPVVPPPAAQIQPPAREISLPLGNLLHLAYNPGYTGAEEARSLLLHRLADESRAGGRARCWNCGSIAIAYERWSTRSKTFGEIGIAFCEICGVWSVM
jgi:hypothetical protein